MTTPTIRLRRHLLAVGAVFLLATGGAAVASPAWAFDPGTITPAVDCFGHQVTQGSVLAVPPGGAPFFGTPGDDVIFGTDGSDVIYGLAGEDTICGRGGGDEIHGDGQNDLIDGESGADVLHGGGGDDVIRGGANAQTPYHDFLYGEDGNDYLEGEGGPDIMNCGTGDPDDYADGGTGMSTGQPEADELATYSGCDHVVNVP